MQPSPRSTPHSSSHFVPRLTPRRLHAYGWLLLNVLAFGATFPIIKWGLPDTTPFRFLFYRFAIAALLAVPILWRSRSVFKKHRQLLGAIALLEFVGTTISLSVLYVGMRSTSAIQTGLISSTGPVFLTVSAIIFLKERVTKREWAGLILACAATILLVILPLFSARSNVGSGNFFGSALVFSQGIILIGYGLCIKKVYHHVPKILTTCVGVMVGLFSFAALSLWEAGQPWQLVAAVQHDLTHVSVWVIALFAAVVTSLIGQTAYMKGQDLIEVSEATLFGYLQTLVYVPLSLILLGEKINLIQVICFGFILIGVFLAECKVRRTAR